MNCSYHFDDTCAYRLILIRLFIQYPILFIEDDIFDKSNSSLKDLASRTFSINVTRTLGMRGRAMGNGSFVSPHSEMHCFVLKFQMDIKILKRFDNAALQFASKLISLIFHH